MINRGGSGTVWEVGRSHMALSLGIVTSLDSENSISGKKLVPKMATGGGRDTVWDVAQVSYGLANRYRDVFVQ